MGELAEIARLLDEAAASPAAALLIEGEPGCGKTLLWRAALAGARERSFGTLVARPAEIEAKLSFAAAADLIQPVLNEGLLRLPAPQAQALRVALLLEPGHVDGRAVATATLSILRALAAERPLVVAIDDVQWLDVPSRHVLAFAARRLTNERVLFLLTRRTGEGDEAPWELEDALGDRLQHARPGPLSVGALHHLLKARLGHSFPRPVVRRLREVSGGNPFFTIELARALDETRTNAHGDRPLDVPGTLRALVHEKLNLLPRSERSVLLAAAALAHPTLDMLAAVDGSRSRAPLRLTRAFETRVIELDGGLVRFTHPLLGSVLYAEATAAERKEVHRRLARVARDPEESARHLALAATGPDTAIAMSLDEAAATVRRRGAPDGAADLVVRAIELTPPGDAAELRRRRLDAAADWVAAGDLQRAGKLLDAALASSAPGFERAEALARLGWVRAHGTSWVEGANLFAEALAEQTAEARVRFSIEKGLAWSSHMLGDLAQAAAHADAAAAIAETLGDRGVLAEALADRAFIAMLRGESDYRSTMDRALELDRNDGWRQIIGRARWLNALILAWSDDLDGARAALDLLLTEALARGDEHALPYILNWLSRIECRAGNYQKAYEHAAESHEASLQGGQDAERVFVLATKALVEAHLGHVQAARSATDEGLVLAESTGIAPARFELLATRGFLELSISALAEARRFLAPLAVEVAAAGFREPAVFRFQADLVETLIGLGDLTTVDAHLTELEASARRLGSRWLIAIAARSRGLLRAAQGELQDALDAFQIALTAQENSGDGFERGRTLACQGIALRRAKRKRAARESLTAALEIFTELGAALWVARARDELSRISGSAPASDAGLTATERRIARLAASGRSNKQVAAELFITVRTVESNLTRVYRKLSIDSRTQLAPRLAQMQEPIPEPG